MKPIALLLALAAIPVAMGTHALAGGGSAAFVQPGVDESGDTRPARDVRAIRREIRTDAVAPTIAPRGYDVTIVMFSDYQCGYCRRLNPVLDALMQSDPKVRLVYRDWPILGKGSPEAARAAIAAKYQGRHAAFHKALMGLSGRIDDTKLQAAAAKAGVDWARLQRDQSARKGEIDAVLARTNRYARMLGLTGTPGMMVGPFVLPGAVDLPTLQRAVKAARASDDPGGR